MYRANLIAAASLVTFLGACGGMDPELQPMTAELAGAPEVVEGAVVAPAELAGQAGAAYEPQQLQAVPADRDQYPQRMLARPPCPMGLTSCDGDCVDLRFDPDNCGACGFSCATPYCAAGRCVNRPTPWVTP